MHKNAALIACFILAFEIYQSDSQDVSSPRLISGDPLFVNYVLGRSRRILGAACTEKISCKRGFLISRARSSIGSESGFHGVRCALRIARHPMPIDRQARVRICAIVNQSIGLIYRAYA